MPSENEEIVLHIDISTARLLRDVLYAQGEHQAAGMPLPLLARADDEKLGAFLRDLDIKLGGAGRMA